MSNQSWTICESERWSRLQALIALRAPAAFVFLALLALFASAPLALA